MSIRIALAAAPLLLFTAYAQDVFNAGSANDGGCPAKQAEQRQYFSRMSGFEARERALERQAADEKGACRDQECVTAANRRDAERHLQLDKQRRDEEARHEKADREIDNSDACGGGGARSSAGGPCETARAAEARQYSARMLDLQKQEIDYAARFDNQRADCRGDGGCLTSAERRHQADLTKLEAERAAEGDRHARARSAIDRGACSTPTTTANGSRPAGNPGVLRGGVEENVYRDPPVNTEGGLPLPPDIRKQLMDGAAAMDRAMDDAQKRAFTASNRFFDCLWKVVRADLAYLGQPAYVPAAQLAKSLHEGAWKYLTSDVYDNNVAMFNGALASLQKFFDDPACTFGEAAPDIAVAVATHLGDSMAAAFDAQKAGDAAIRIASREEERRAGYGAATGQPRSPGVPRYNPDCAPNMCFPSAFAQELSIETGESFAAKPFAGNFEIQIIKGVPVKVFNLTNDPTIQSLLGGIFGNKKLQGPPLSPQRIANQMVGKPTLLRRSNGKAMSGKEAHQAIHDEMNAAGPGSRAVVFLHGPGNQGGHVVEAIHGGRVNSGGSVSIIKDTKGGLVGDVVFPDASNGNMDATHLIRNAQSVSIYRTH
jgi:hypothetical protein